jgi:hypothetical protein
MREARGSRGRPGGSGGSARCAPASGTAAAPPHGVEDLHVDALARQWPELQDRRGLVGRGGQVVEAHQHQAAGGGRLDQGDAGLQHHRAGALAAHQRAGQVKAPLWQELLQRVAGHLPREAPERSADGLPPGHRQLAQGGVQLADTTAGHDRALCRLGRGRAGGHAGAVVQQQLQRDHALGRPAPGNRVRAAGVVADHAAERAAAVGGWVRPHVQAVDGGGAAQVVEDHPRLGPGDAPLRVDLDDPVQMAGAVDHHAAADRLPGDAGPAAAEGQRHARLAAGRQRGLDVGGVAREDDAQRHAAVQRGVAGVLRPPARTEVHLAADRRAQRRRQLTTLILPRHRFSWPRPAAAAAHDRAAVNTMPVPALGVRDGVPPQTSAASPVQTAIVPSRPCSGDRGRGSHRSASGSQAAPSPGW